MTQTRVPVTMAASLALHAGGLALWLKVASRAPETVSRVISDVDILVADQRQQAGPPPKAVTMKDFLKLALPTIPKAGPLEARAPEARRAPLEIPRERLSDRGRIAQPAKLDALAPERRRVEAAKFDAPVAQRAVRAPVAAPVLEEVGARRAPRKVLEMAALAEERQAAPRPMGLSALSSEPERRRPQAAAALLPAEAQPQGRPLSKLADMLSSEPLALEPRAAPAARLERIEAAAPAPAPVRAAAQEAPKKSVSIEGPLSNRKVLAYSVPAFPQWLKDLGVLEADVAIRFSVDPSGAVLEGMKVERTSGYGRLDRLAMEHLKLWRFGQISDPRNEWGVITFRFVLE